MAKYQNSTVVDDRSTTRAKNYRRVMSASTLTGDKVLTTPVKTSARSTIS